MFRVMQCAPGIFPLAALLFAACSPKSYAETPDRAPSSTPAPAVMARPTGATRTEPEAPVPPAAAAKPETSLGVTDRGIFSDLDHRIQLSLPADTTASLAELIIDEKRQLAVLYIEGFPRKVYPLGGPVSLPAAGGSIGLRPGDAEELRPILGEKGAGSTRRLHEGEVPSPGDRDSDGIPDPLDVLIGGYKTAINRDKYGAGYIVLDYPMGDVPRDVGVCTDVVVRAMRNAGLDLQAELQRDIRRSRRSYPMVKGGGDKNIDHRRVKTLLPYFLRHFQSLDTALDHPSWRPGDIVLMDTFPSRPGPDHIGIVSDRKGDSGYALIINNWTDGTYTTEMDLLGWVPITHRFRIR